MTDDFFKQQQKIRNKRLKRIDNVTIRCEKLVNENDLEKNIKVRLRNKKRPWKMPKSRPVSISTELYHKVKNIAYMNEMKVSYVWKLACNIISNALDMLMEVEERPSNTDWMSIQWATKAGEITKKQKEKIIALTQKFSMDDDYENINKAEGF